VKVTKGGNQKSKSKCKNQNAKKIEGLRFAFHFAPYVSLREKSRAVVTQSRKVIKAQRLFTFSFALF
jgi:hypothetical protein